MKIVDVSHLYEKKGKGKKLFANISELYAFAEQPYIVLESNEDLKEYINGLDKKGRKIEIYDRNALIEFLSNLETLKPLPINQLKGYDTEVWLKTIDEYIPDYWINDDTELVYKKDITEQMVKTDGVYVRLYLVYRASSYATMYTSAGVYNLNAFKYNVSGGVKSQWCRESGLQKKNKEFDAIKVKALFESKRYYIQDARLFNLLFNPLSDFFYFNGNNPDYNLMKAIDKAYSKKIKVSEINRFTASERFRRIIVKELTFMINQLSKAVQETINPTDFASLMLQIAEKAIEKGTTDDALKAMHAIAKLGYAVPDEAVDDMLPTVNNKQIKAGTNFSDLVEVKQVQDDVMPLISEFKDGELKGVVADGNKAGEGMEAEVKEPVFNKSEFNKRMKELEKETDTIDGYVHEYNDVETDKESE